jgi:hypothetical protein
MGPFKLRSKIIPGSGVLFVKGKRKDGPSSRDKEIEIHGWHEGCCCSCTVIQNYFPRCGFGNQDAVDKEKKDQNNRDWVKMQGKMDCPNS